MRITILDKVILILCKKLIRIRHNVIQKKTTIAKYKSQTTKTKSFIYYSLK